jgi:regulator of sirC expression with transglutaminase-like and TPR domain
VTGEPETYVTEADAAVSADLWEWADRHAHLRESAVRGVLVPEGMVAVNPDDLAHVFERGHLYTAVECERCARVRAVLAASNPTTETNPDA